MWALARAGSSPALGTTKNRGHHWVPVVFFKGESAVRIAIYQMNMEWEKPAKNVEKIKKAARKAASWGSKILLTPELSISTFTKNPSKVTLTEEMEISLEEISRDISIGVGFFDFQDGKAFNSYAIFSKGKQLCKYRKIHLFSHGGEDGICHPGDHLINCELENVMFSIFICYDLRFPCPFQRLAEKTHVFVVPANWPEKRISHWKILLKARAVENQSFVVGVNRSGKDSFFVYGGSSMVIDPWGEEIISLSVEESLIFVDIDIDKLERIRENFPVLPDRREEVDNLHFHV